VHCQLRKHNKEDEDDDNEFEDDDDVDDCWGGFVFDRVAEHGSAIVAFGSHNKAYIRLCLMVLLAVLYFVYFVYALSYDFGDEGSVRLLWITCLVVVIVGLVKLRCYLGRHCTWMTYVSDAFDRIGRHYILINKFVYTC